MAFGWLKNIFRKKNITGNDSQIDAVYENPFYESGDNEAVNPFFQEDPIPAVHDTAGIYSSAGNTQLADTVKAPAAQISGEYWNMQNVGGLPTIESIENMVGGLKMDKIDKHASVRDALAALRQYQELMSQPQTIRFEETSLLRKNHKGNAEVSEVTDIKVVEDAFQALGTFILNAKKVVKSGNGFFASRSSNVQKLSPVFANMIMRANGLLPKLANLENLVGPYLLEGDRRTFTYGELLNSDLAGSRSGGVVTQGIEENNGSIDFTQEEIGTLFSNQEDKDKMGTFREMRRNRIEKARLGMLIPTLPVGILKGQREAAGSEASGKALMDSAEKMADAYIAELGPLLTALSDAVEGYETTGVLARADLHKKQAHYFRASKLIQRVRQQKQVIMQILLEGFPRNIDESSAEHREIMQLYLLGGSPLAGAVETLNDVAFDQKFYTRLVDREGKDLQEKDDYLITGGNLSISIIDHANKQVLRAPKKSAGGYLNETEQKNALNGINDEAVAKVSQFLGFHVVADAKAAGFMAREKGSTNETAVFGGSIMEKVEGQSARGGFLPTFSGWDQNNFTENEKLQKVDLGKHGRLIGDMMKMALVDQLVMHGDRNAGNFMVNLNAEAGKSTVIAIDNDVIFGENGFEYNLGQKSSMGVLHTIKDRMHLDFGSTLSVSFPMVTQEVKDAVEKLDLDAFGEMLMPYTDRVMRMVVIERAKELKEWVTKVPVMDLNKEEDISTYIKLATRASMTEWAKGMLLTKSGSVDNAAIKMIPGEMIRWLSESYKTKTNVWGGDLDTVITMKTMGLSRAEAEQILLENMKNEADETSITREQLDASRMGAYFKDYDMPMMEFLTKYKRLG